MAAAGLDLQAVAAAIAFAAQVDNGLDALAREVGDLPGARLGGAPHAGRDLVLVEVDRAEDVVVHEEQIEIVQGALDPGRARASVRARKPRYFADSAFE